MAPRSKNTNGRERAANDGAEIESGDTNLGMAQLFQTLVGLMQQQQQQQAALHQEQMAALQQQQQQQATLHQEQLLALQKQQQEARNPPPSQEAAVNPKVRRMVEFQKLNPPPFKGTIDPLEAEN